MKKYDFTTRQCFCCLSSSLRPCCQTEIAFKNWLYTTGTDSSSRYSANAMQLNKSCYITLSKDPGCHQMVCYGLWKTTMTVMTGHWSPWATSRPVRCPKSCVEATSLSTERGGGTAVKLDTFVALENESTMSLISYRQNKADLQGLQKQDYSKGRLFWCPSTWSSHEMMVFCFLMVSHSVSLATSGWTPCRTSYPVSNIIPIEAALTGFKVLQE